jgi:tetratricopeptide (TPR) repeat protein
MKHKRTLETWRSGHVQMAAFKVAAFKVATIVSLSGLVVLLVSAPLSLSTSTWLMTAEAQDSDQTEELFDDKRGDTAVDQDTLDQSELAFFEGLTSYRAKKYKDAAEHFKKAYKLVPFRDLLFNVARSYEEQGDKDNAIKYYKMYFETKPIDETQIIHRLRQFGVYDVGVEKPNPNRNIRESPEPISTGATSHNPRKILMWSALGGGAAFILMGTYFGVDALGQAEDARGATGQRKYEDFKAAAESSALWADLSMTVGLAAIAGGIFLWMTDDTSSGVNHHTDVVGASPKFDAERRVRWRVNMNDHSTTLGIFGTF